MANFNKFNEKISYDPKRKIGEQIDEETAKIQAFNKIEAENKKLAEAAKNSLKENGEKTE